METEMQKKKIAEDYARILSGHGHVTEKREIIIRAILEEQKKFINTCKQKWGKQFYSEIVADC